MWRSYSHVTNLNGTIQTPRIAVSWGEIGRPVSLHARAPRHPARDAGRPALPGIGGSMPVRATAADATSKWVTNLSGSTERIKAGVQRVTTAPGQKAAAQSQKWLQRVTASQDKWRQRVASVSLQSWQASMTDVGIPRVAQGAQA